MNKVIKAELKAPFTEKERLDFIVENNHQLGYLIEELEDGLQAYINEKTEEELAQEEQDRINQLTMTALDLVTYIRKAGATTEEIVNYLNTNPEVYLQLTLCQNVYCGVVRQLAPIKVNDELTITDEQIITIFKDKNQL